MTATLKNTQMLARPARALAGWSTLTTGRPPAQWRPIPQALPVRRVIKRAAAAHAKSSHGIWISPERDSLGEKLMLLLLLLAGAVAIGYGVSCLLDLVQNWAAFNAGTARLIQ